MQCAIGFSYGAPFDWRMMKATTSNLHITEMEWFAQTLTMVMASAYDYVVVFMGNHTKRPYIQFCDNSAAVLLSDKDFTSRKFRHVALRLKYMQEKCASRFSRLIYITNKAMLANIGTKIGISAQEFHEHRSYLLK